MNQVRKVYMDYAATTPVDHAVLEAMLPFFEKTFGNPSSTHAYAREVRPAIDEARAHVAALCNANANEIYFTAGGTESDNWALKGVALAYPEKRHIITSQIEHHAILHTCEDLEKLGREVTYLPVTPEGIVTPESVEAAIRPDTALVSVMFANNEVGTVQPVQAIGEVCHAHGIPFHTDAVQAFGVLPIDVKTMPIDYMSMSAHKLYGPKGIGALYVRKFAGLLPLLAGGGQERGKRSGTENVPGIVGFGKAAQIAKRKMQEETARLTSLRDDMIQAIERDIPQVKLNGSRVNRLPNNVNMTFRYAPNESVLLMLDMNGVAASGGSACSAGATEPSHVLLAMGASTEDAQASIRFTLGRDTTQEDISYVVEKLQTIVARQRALQPLFAQTAEAPKFV